MPISFDDSQPILADFSILRPRHTIIDVPVATGLHTNAALLAGRALSCPQPGTSPG